MHVSATYTELYGIIARASEEVGYSWKVSLGRFGHPNLEFIHEKRIADEGLHRFCRRTLGQLWIPAGDPNEPRLYAQQFGADVVTLQVREAAPRPRPTSARDGACPLRASAQVRNAESYAVLRSQGWSNAEEAGVHGERDIFTVYSPRDARRRAPAIRAWVAAVVARWESDVIRPPPSARERHEAMLAFFAAMK